jgi:hypothetical protein
METTLQYMQTYYCIMEPKHIPICGFSSVESALKYKSEMGIAGEIKLFDTRTMEYLDA